MRTSTLSSFVVAALGVGLASAAGATTARSVDLNGTETARTTVHYNDLDIHTRQGADQLYSRLNMAAVRVCEDIIEPYLIQCGYLQRTPRGRLLTSHAFRHLGLAEPTRDPAQFGLFGNGDSDD